MCETVKGYLRFPLESFPEIFFLPVGKVRRRECTPPTVLQCSNITRCTRLSSNPESAPCCTLFLFPEYHGRCTKVLRGSLVPRQVASSGALQAGVGRGWDKTLANLFYVRKLQPASALSALPRFNPLEVQLSCLIHCCWTQLCKAETKRWKEVLEGL